MLHRLLPLFFAAVFLAACGGAMIEQPESGGSVSVVPGTSDGGAKDEFAPLPYPNGSGGDGSALIVNASLSLAVDEMEAAIREARATVSTAGGVLVALSRGSDGGYPIYTPDGSLAAIGDGPAFLTFRVPSATLESTIDALRPLGELVGERSDTSDVSASLRDLAARLKNLRAAESNYQRLLAQATNVGDLLAVTAQLDSVRGQIEQLVAEQAALTDAVARSTLSLALYPPATPIADAAERFDLGAIIEAATGSLVGVAIALVTVAVYTLVIGLPLGLLVGLAYLLVGRRLLRLLPGRRAKRR